MTRKVAIFKPTTTIQLRQPHWITQTHLHWLSILYQPLIGAVATQLYTNFHFWIFEETWDSEPMPVSHWLNQADLTIEQWEKAIDRLQGISLLRIFEDPGNQQYWLEIEPPVDPNHFFADDLLSTLLHESVGERQFKQIKSRYAIDVLPSDCEEVTKSFYQVFPLPYAMMSIKFEQEPAENAAYLTWLDDGGLSLDWQLILDQLKTQGIDKTAVDDHTRQMANALQRFYGIDELNMARFLYGALNADKTQVDADKLKQVIYSSYENHPTNLRNKAKRADSSEMSNQIALGNDNQTSKGLSGRNRRVIAPATDANPALLKAFKQIPSLPFYSQLRQKIGGNEMDHEKRTIRNSLETTATPAEVINVLLHYLLVELGQDHINKAFFDTILNKWTIQGVTTAEQAIAAARLFKNEKAKAINNSQAARKTRYGKSGREEPLPDWAKKELDELYGSDSSDSSNVSDGSGSSEGSESSDKASNVQTQTGQQGNDHSTDDGRKSSQNKQTKQNGQKETTATDTSRTNSSDIKAAIERLERLKQQRKDEN
ncbi:DnaD domain protein [Bavariicoccus seileri]|uniref:DnaD domain protein n=1 Tax=Bavariicoccus seileri TaxID=549685 RepID=UPI003F905317